MKNFILYLLLVLGSSGSMLAQSGWQPFEQVIDYEDRVEAAGSMTILDDTIYFYSKGWGQQDPYMRRKVVLNKCDLEGHLISQQILFENDPYSYQPIPYKEILVTSDSNLLLISARTDGLSSKYSYNVFLAKLTRQGDTIWNQEYGSADTSEVLSDCKWTPWGDLFCVGYRLKDPDDFDAYATLFDSNGSQLWANQYHYSANDGFLNIAAIRQNPIQYTVTGGVLYSIPLFKGFRWKLDDIGNVVNMIQINSILGCGLHSYESSDNGSITVQCSDEMPNYPERVSKWDSNWVKEWSVLINDQDDKAYIASVSVLPDSSYWLCGWGYTNENPTSNYAQLVKIAKNGNVKWHRRYYLSTTDVNARLEYVTYYAPTNAVYGIGTTLRKAVSNNSDAWLVRFDTAGCLEPGCDTIVGTEIPLPLQPDVLSVFPNPTTTQLAVDIPPALRESARQLIIRNLSGQEVITLPLTATPRKLVDVAGLPAGLYLVEVWGQEGMLGRVKFVKQ